MNVSVCSFYECSIRSILNCTVIFFYCMNVKMWKNRVELRGNNK